MRETIRIERWFQGPPRSGNGGYVAGRLASFIEGPAVVRLRVPPPLEVDLEVHREGDGVALVHDDVVVCEGRPAPLELEPPDPPSAREAEAASADFRELASHWFPSCFVCGPDRGPGDGLRILPGPVGSRDRVACPWIPDASLGAAGGDVAPEFLWAPWTVPARSRSTGRRHTTATALFGESGSCRDVGLGTWLEVPIRPEDAPKDSASGGIIPTRSPAR